MENLIKGARIAYGIMVIGLAIQQLVYAEFRPVIFPPWPDAGILPAVFTYAGSFAVVLVGLAILFERNARKLSLVLGVVLLFVLVFCQIPYELVMGFYKHLGSWSSAIKEMAICGGAFVVADSFPITAEGPQKKLNATNISQRLAPLGRILFGLMLALFGADHFLYPDFCVSLIPAWIPWAGFWVYFAGVALVASGVSIIMGIKKSLIGTLTALMMFLWLITLHIPRAIIDPYTGKGNELSSVFESLGFSGIALLTAWSDVLKKYDQ